MPLTRSVSSKILLELSARVWLTRFAADETFVRYASIAQLEWRYGEGLLHLAAQ